MVTHHQIDRLTDLALDAFWETVATECPEAKTGDMPPLSTIALDEAARAAVAEWIAHNGR